MVYWDYSAMKVLTLEYVPGLCWNYPVYRFDWLKCSGINFSNWLVQLGVKINKLDTLAARGYNRSRIASRAIEAYLIQVNNNTAKLLFKSVSFSFWFETYVYALAVLDTQNGLLSCGSTPRESCNWCRWINHILWLWHDGRDKNIYSEEIAWSLLFCIWKRCKKGNFFPFPG